MLRPAATLLLVRDGGDGLEVLLARRGEKGDFPGLHVFPGGLVDPGDRSGTLLAASRLSERDAARRLPGLEDPLAWYLAAVRESFEEAGVLLGEGLPDETTRLDWHRRVAARDATFADLVAAHDIRLATDTLGLFSHWITPTLVPRRYDTRFFVARMPADQEPRPDGRETVRFDWFTPRAALEAGERREIQLIFPTIRNLEALAAFADAESLLAYCATPRVVPAIMPKMVSGADGMRLLLPGDAGYDEA